VECAGFSPDLIISQIILFDIISVMLLTNTTHPKKMVGLSGNAPETYANLAIKMLIKHPAIF
jgi:hypothetical protein